MSDRPCNLCAFKQLQRQYAKKGMSLRLRRDPLPGKTFAQGVVVHAVPKGQKAPADWSWNSPTFLCWYAALPERCEC